MKSLLAIVGMALLNPLLVMVLLITTRLFIEFRYIPGATMQPTLSEGDRVLVEKISTYLNKPITRGEIIVFYPPPIELDGADLSWDPMHIMGRLTGLPFF